MFYNNFTLKADEVEYDQAGGKVTAIGNIELREPNGNIVRAERLDITDDFRDAFIQSLSAVTKDDTRIVGERATRSEGNITEFEKGKFTPCKSTPGHAAAVVHQRRKDHPRPVERDDHLPGCLVRDLRPARACTCRTSSTPIRASSASPAS